MSEISAMSPVVAETILVFIIGPEIFYEKSSPGPMLFSVDSLTLLKPCISFHQQAWFTLSTQCVHCVLSVDQAFFLKKKKQTLVIFHST